MKKDTICEAPQSKPQLNLTDSGIKGIEDLNIDDNITITLNVKITEISRNTYDKKRPLNIRAEIMSGKLIDSKIKDDIDDAKNTEQLEKAVKDLPKGK